MIGSSATQLAETLSRMIETTVLRQRKGEYKGLEPTWKEGDEIIISETDHESQLAFDGANMITPLTSILHSFPAQQTEARGCGLQSDKGLSSSSGM